MLQAALIEGGAECNIVSVLVATGEFRIPLKGFGSTDCRRCRSHLLHLRDGGAAGKRAGLFGLTSFGSSVPGAECCPGRDRTRAMARGGRRAHTAAVRLVGPVPHRAFDRFLGSG